MENYRLQKELFLKMRFISPEKILSVIGMIKTNDLAQTVRVSIVSPQKIFWRFFTNRTEF